MGGRRWGKDVPWLLPAAQPLELSFFQKVYAKLLEQLKEYAEDGDHPTRIPMLVFHRAMSRLYRVLRENRNFKGAAYDLDNDGTISWWEFCVLWQREQLHIRLSTVERIYLTMEDPHASVVGQLVSGFVLFAIVISALSFIVSTLPSMQEAGTCETCAPVPYPIFRWTDGTCVVLFTVEYLVRLCSAAFMRFELLNKDDVIGIMCADEVTREPTKVQRVWQFVKAWPNLIDLVAILPSYIAWVTDAVADNHENMDGDGAVAFKLLRLMRVVRAFRLGRRFEAVIIIGRAMHLSLRALSVLIVNLAMTMLVFGAIMFYMEGGDYNPETGLYDRFDGWELNETTSRYVEVSAPSPFVSIPHCFWWALVTTTTVGYGDVYPTTMWGKVTALLAMVWSLCVLALPVGVIGNNFEMVWDEYYEEQQFEREQLERENDMIRQTLGGVDPLAYSQRLLLEVYHSSNLMTRDNDVFLGEVEVTLGINPYSPDTVHKEIVAPLKMRRKNKCSVSGELHIRYSWTPQHPFTEVGLMLEGTLDLTIVKAEHLMSVDWMGSPIPDPFVIASLYPTAASPDGTLTPTVHTFSTRFGEVTPTWHETERFAFRWSKEGWEAKRNKDRIALAQLNEHPKDDTRHFCQALPRIQRDVEQLKNDIPRIQEELRQLHANARLILHHLGVDSTDSDAEEEGRRHSVDEASAKHDGQRGGHLHVPSVISGAIGRSDNASRSYPVTPPRSQETDSRVLFLVPGVVPEDTLADEYGQEGTAADAPGAMGEDDTESATAPLVPKH